MKDPLKGQSKSYWYDVNVMH